MLRNMKINRRIFWVLLISLMLSSTFVFQTSRISTQKIVEDFLYNYVKLNLDNIESSLEFSINHVNMLSVRLLTYHDIYRLLLDQPDMPAAEKQAKLAGMLDGMMIDHDVIGEIFIITQDGSVYNKGASPLVDMPDQSFIQEIERSNVPIWGKTKKDAEGNAYIFWQKISELLYKSEIGIPRHLYSGKSDP